MTSSRLCYKLTMNKIMRTSVIAVTGASLLTLAAPLVASASGASSATSLYNCSTLTQRPREIVLTCADANLYVAHITWSSWSGASAHAKGTLHWNTCTPTCVAGAFKSKSISFVATGRRKVKGVWLYTELKSQKNTWTTGSALYSLPTSPL
jgi:hypothetical protein